MARAHLSDNDKTIYIGILGIIGLYAYFDALKHIPRYLKTKKYKLIFSGNLLPHDEYLEVPYINKKSIYYRVESQYFQHYWSSRRGFPNWRALPHDEKVKTRSYYISNGQNNYVDFTHAMFTDCLTKETVIDSVDKNKRHIISYLPKDKDVHLFCENIETNIQKNVVLGSVNSPLIISGISQRKLLLNIIESAIISFLIGLVFHALMFILIAQFSPYF
jgi:hypothetical protein